jgi:hypothetical protein
VLGEAGFEVYYNPEHKKRIFFVNNMFLADMFVADMFETDMFVTDKLCARALQFRIAG